MSGKSYDYANREGVEAISWEGFGSLSRILVEQVAPHSPEVVVGVARAGLFAAAAVACGLRLDLLPIRLTRRDGDRVVRERPLWRVDVSPEVAGKRVVVVDEIAASGETLRIAAERVSEVGAASVVTASLVAHTWADPMPGAVALLTDAFVIFPWDAEVFDGAAWHIHPEIEAGLRGEAPA